MLFSPYPRLYGYCLLAPRRHATNIVSDFTEDDYLALQQRCQRLGRVLAEITPSERLYVFSFGSMQEVAHVHWHLAPLPPGTPSPEQQLAAFGKLEYLVIAKAERDELAIFRGRFRYRFQSVGTAPSSVDSLTCPSFRYPPGCESQAVADWRS